jgi:excisionase family DNA binding protein
MGQKNTRADLKRYLSAREVARQLGVSSSWLYEEIARKRFPHTRLGPRRVGIDPDELAEFLRLRGVSAGEAHEHAAEREARYR